MNQRLRILVVVVAALALSIGAIADNSVAVRGSGEGNAIGQNQIKSTGELRVGQDTYPVTTIVTILALGPGQGHTLVGQTTHLIDFGGGDTITTMDKGLLVPVNNFGLYQLLIKCDITGGTGKFAGAAGDLTFTGRVNLAVGHVEWRVKNDRYGMRSIRAISAGPGGARRSATR